MTRSLPTPPRSYRPHERAQGGRSPQVSPPSRRRSRPTPAGGRRYFLGGVMLAVVGFIANPTDWLPATETAPDRCATVVESGAVLSRAELGQLLDIPERSSVDQVRQAIAQPYCELPSLEVRPGVAAQREAYPLEFDPNTWLIVLFEEGEYAGYDFAFQP